MRDAGWRRYLILAATAALGLFAACGDGEEPGTDGPIMDRVEADLDRFTGPGVPGAAPSRAYRVTDEADLIGGPSATGRVGDYMIENGVVRFLIESDYRGMSPCPWGGNIIDADIQRDGEPGRDLTGESCLMFNIGQTLRPVDYEILADGSDGQAAIIAVTGYTTTLDFLNIRAMAEGFVPGLGALLRINPDGDLPLTVTVYYVLRPGERQVAVVSAVRNDGDEELLMTVGHLIIAAGNTDYYNPLSRTQGFGYRSLGVDNIAAEFMTYIAQVGPDNTTAIVPEPYAEIDAALPVGAGYTQVSGAAVTLFGNTDLLGTLTGTLASLRGRPGTLVLQPGESDVRVHWQLVGDGNLDTVAREIWPLLDVPTGTVTGQLSGPNAAGVRITAVTPDGQGYNQTWTAADGSYELVVPVGDYSIIARRPFHTTHEREDVSVSAGQTVTANLAAPAQGTITVQVRDPDGSPVPAQVLLLCDGACPTDRETGAEANLSQNPVPAGTTRVLATGADGNVTFTAAPGTWRVHVNRGITWSSWPPIDDADAGLITLGDGGTETVTAEIAQVVQQGGVLSGDFHVHALGSPDSPITQADRVANMVAAGVDFIVSTDHDVITDFAPTIEALGLTAWIRSIIGDEMTTPEQGHFNSFPLQRDEEDRLGGALDWGRGEDNGMLIGEIFEWAHAFPGEQVVQMNHPWAGMGAIGNLKIDPLLGTSAADPVTLRLDPPDTTGLLPGDTGLWSEDFTAIELMNGHDMGSYWEAFRWWLTMIGRGFTPTGTAVTDTHQINPDLGGVPRAFVFVPSANDSVATFNEAITITAINQGRLIGSNGPFFRARVETADTDAVVGETMTLGTDNEPLLVVDIEIPEWMIVDTVQVYMNVEEGIFSAPGAGIDSPLPPTLETTFLLDPATDLHVVATGNAEHRAWRRQVTLPLGEIDRDTYVIVVVTQTDETVSSMYPVVPRQSLRPYAFSNPIYIDADGGGYNNYPLQALVNAQKDNQATLGSLDPAVRAATLRAERVAYMREHLEEHHGFEWDGVEFSPRVMAAIFEWATCTH